MAKPQTPDETPEQLLARVEAEHGPEIAAVVAKELNRTQPRAPQPWRDARRTTEGRRGRSLPAQGHSRYPRASW